VKVLVTHPGSSLYGSDRMLLETLIGMVDAGLDAVLTVPQDGPLVEEAERHGVPVVLSPVPVLRKSALSLRGFAALARSAAAGLVRGGVVLRRVRPDVVYVSTLTTPTWILLARAAGAPVVGHVHEAESGPSRWLQRLMTAPLLACSALLVNSTYALDVLAHSWPELRSRSTVVLNGVAGPPPAVPPPPRPAGPVRLLYVGRLSERKGVLVALAALEELLRTGVDVRLDLVGDVFAEHAEFAHRLHDRVARSELRDHVAIHGFAVDVWTHLSACDILLVPSVLPEPFGNSAVEGVLAARPVIASRTGGLPEAVGHFTSTRLVAPGDPVDLAAAIRTVISSLPEVAAAAQRDAARAAALYAPRRYRDDVVAHVLATVRSPGLPSARALVARGWSVLGRRDVEELT